MYNSEKKTIFSVLTLYLTSTILLVTLLANSYYEHEKLKLQEEEKNILINYAKDIYCKLDDYHNKLQGKFIYPRYKKINSAIYDIDKKIIFSTLLNKKIDFKKNFYYLGDYSYYIYEITPYYLGAAYIVIEMKNHAVLKNVGKNVIFLSITIILILIFTSLFLVKLMLKPIRENVKFLDRFIKDTTHELNTPISTILTNIELLEDEEICEKSINKLNRIKTASITISNIYEDLVYASLHHNTISKNEMLKINEIIKQRVDYFEILFKSKGITVSINNIDTCKLFIDKKKITRLLDNIISNAIKYSKKFTHIQINIEKKSFQIIDEGNGMTEKEIQTLFDRYTRFNNTQGGFGLGFNIIYSIAKEYNLKIKIDSKINEGTCVNIYW